jgi:hypothetical protein
VGFSLFPSPFESDILSVFLENSRIRALAPKGAKVFGKAMEKGAQVKAPRKMYSEYLGLLREYALSKVTNERQVFIKGKDKHEAVCAQKYILNKTKPTSGKSCG